MTVAGNNLAKGNGTTSEQSTVDGQRRKPMRIAVSASGPSIDAEIDERFGRCPYFVLADSNGSGFEAVANPNTKLGHGAGIQAARLLVERGVSVVLTGRCGPNACDTLAAGRIELVTGSSGTVRQVLEEFTSGRDTPLAVETESFPDAGERSGGSVRPPDDVTHGQRGEMGRRKGRGRAGGSRRGVSGRWRSKLPVGD
jgi:predicted Fe-Mo cluster-binding NifX family protein